MPCLTVPYRITALLQPTANTEKKHGWGCFCAYTVGDARGKEGNP